MVNRGYKIDLHSHSIISYDGGIRSEDYEQLLDEDVIDYIAITDHNQISFAQEMQYTLGDRIIVGEEVMTNDGELIGLFLEKVIPSGLSAKDTVCQIYDQGGVVYLPHPFESMRNSMQLAILEQLKDKIDIVEVFNARAFGRGKSKQAFGFAKKYAKAMAASSDAHIRDGVGCAYSVVNEVPNRRSLVHLLHQAEYKKEYAPMLSLLAPTVNKLKHRLF